MHTTIAIPDDVPLVALARAMGSIGLRAAPYEDWERLKKGRKKYPIATFRHDAPAQGLPAACDVPGCERLATTRDGDKTICAKHWIAARNGV
jgi:hypothetical protein